MVPECPHCHIAVPSSQARHCPRCGTALPPPAGKPIHLEKPGTLFNLWFAGSLIVVLAGAWLATQGHLRFAAVTLAIGLVAMLFTTIRGQTK